MPTDLSPSRETTALPLLPLRDVVVFPHMVIPLFVGRPKSIKALDVAMAAGDLYDIASIATVLQMLKLPDGTVKVLVEGTQRARIVRVEERGEYLAADAQPIAQHVGPRLTAHVDRAGLRGEGMGQPMIDGDLAAIDRLQSIFDGRHFRSGQRIKRQRCDLCLGGVEPVEGGRDGLPIRYRTRTHSSNTSSNH